MTRSLATLLLLLGLASALIAQDDKAADTLFLNGHILTGEDLASGNFRFVSSLAVRDGIVIAAGDNLPASLRAGSTRVVDLHGAFAMPGLNDAHIHIAEAGRRRLAVNLTAAASLAETQQRIRAAAASAAPGAWLQGGGWDHTLWPGAALPTRADIDAVAAGHPAFFMRIDGHIAVVSSAALAAAGITRATPDPEGGKIDRDAQGEPTGILREGPATALVLAKIPPPSHDLRRRGAELAVSDAIAHGLTSVQDNSDWDDFLVYEEMEREGKLGVRISEWLPFNAPLDVLKQHRIAHPAEDRLLRTGMLKGFLDGSLGSRTAALKAPYADDPGNSGIPRYTQKQLNQLAVERAEAGFQMGFHAIGDRANSMALDAFQQSIEARRKMMQKLLPRLEKQTGAQITVTDAPRYRIEHAQVVDPADIARFKKLGVIASMQPNHLLTDMNWAEQRLGPQRARYAYAWKAFLDAGVPLAFGTDYPVEPITPFRGIYAAVTRTNEAGTKTYFPEDKLTLAQALYAYTQGSAYAEFTEDWKGKLAPGYVADMVVLDRDLTRISPPEILQTKVLRTVVSGTTVYWNDPGH